MASHSYSLALSLLLALVACGEKAKPVKSGDNVAQTEPKQDVAPFRVPEESEIKDTIVLRSVRRGRALVRNTKDSLPHNVGAALNCTNCHFNDGTLADGMPFVGVLARYPQYRARSGRMDLIEDRINDCFVRSLNGKALAANSPEMRDIVTYFAFLSRGFPQGKDMKGQGLPKLDPLKGDTVRGLQVYVSNCARCHGADGNGMVVDTIHAPPLWGSRSYNIGAGMARVRTTAAFVHQLMPRDRPRTLTPQQAFDVAAYVDSRPRPDYAGKERDWPSGGAPPDVAYPVLSSGKTAASPAAKK